MKKLMPFLILLLPLLVQANESKSKSAKKSKSSIKADWIIHPSGQCVKAEGQMSLPKVMEANPACVLKDDKDLLKGLTLLDCTSSELGVKLMFADTLSACKKAVSQAKDAGAM